MKSSILKMFTSQPIQKFLVLSPTSTSLPKATVDTAPLSVDVDSPANSIHRSQHSSIMLCAAPGPIEDIEAHQPQAPLANGFLRVGFDGVEKGATK